MQTVSKENTRSIVYVDVKFLSILELNLKKTYNSGFIIIKYGIFRPEKKGGREDHKCKKALNFDSTFFWGGSTESFLILF